MPGADAERVRLGCRRAVRLSAVRKDGLLTSSAESLSASSDVCCGGTTSSQLLTSCMFWFTSHTLPEFTSFSTTRSRFTRNTYYGDALAFGTSTVLVISIIRAVTDILVRPRPRRMDTPAQLHRSRRNTLTIKRHRLRRRPIQRLQQQRLRRRHRHHIRLRTGLLQLRVLRIRQRQLTPARQKQLPPPGIQHHRLIPHHSQLQITRTLQPVPRACLGLVGFTVRAHFRDGHLAGLRIRAVDPVVRPDRGYQPLRTLTSAGSLVPRSKPLTVDGDSAHTLPLAASVTEMTSEPKLTSAAPGQLLVPAQPHVAGDTWFRVEPVLSSTNTSRRPAGCRRWCSPASPPHPAPARDNSAGPQHSWPC